MASKLIIIRGNSGSGKTTIAKKLRQAMGDGTMLVSQDVLRREILKVKDGPDNPSIHLIYDTVMYGSKIGYDVILEGILANKHYGDMLLKLAEDFPGTLFAYYFDLPLEETLKRHATKPNASDFGESEMREWWNDKDYLGLEQEKYFNEEYSEGHILQAILEDLQVTSSKPAG
ncbi:MAG TPA: kinase [Candidatus Saccharimonadales bacterium]|nr:kinase [Candidatus Saccharimonadales bacterium]